MSGGIREQGDGGRRERTGSPESGYCLSAGLSRNKLATRIHISTNPCGLGFYPLSAQVRNWRLSKGSKACPKSHC